MLRSNSQAPRLLWLEHQKVSLISANTAWGPADMNIIPEEAYGPRVRTTSAERKTDVQKPPRRGLMLPVRTRICLYEYELVIVCEVSLLLATQSGVIG